MWRLLRRQRWFSNEVNKIRNIGISAHIDSGKTTLTERILFYTGRIHEIHEVRGKDGVGAKMDSMELEREKGITIKSAATFTTWKGNHINIIDTPGHVDFQIEVERALRVLDGAVLVVCGVGGVQSQTMTVDRQMRRYNVPRICFINKLDRDGANPFRTVEEIRNKLRLQATLVQVPIGAEENLKGVVDIIEEKSHYFEGVFGEVIRVEDGYPAELKDTVEQTRMQLIERLGEIDEEIEEMFVMEETPTKEQLFDAVRRNTLALKFVPVFVGSAFKNRGVQTMLDGVLNYLPSPDLVRTIALDTHNEEKEVVLTPDANKDLVALAFKLEKSRFGQLTYMRVYQGTLRRGAYIYPTVEGKTEKVKAPRLVRMHSNDMEDIDEATPGEIVAMFGIDCNTGTTFTNGKIQYSMESMYVPEPVISLSVKPKSASKDLDNFSKALARFSQEDPTFRVEFDKDTNETVISGMGELHLQIYVERMLREYNVEVVTGLPKVRFQETIGHKADFDYLHKKQTGGAGQYGRVIGYIEPLPEDSKTTFEFENFLVGENIPPQYHISCQKGFESAAELGYISGSPVVGVRVVLTDGASHAVDSSDRAFQTAAQYAFRQAFEKADPVLLQPVMSVEVEVPSEFQGDVVAGISKRKALIRNTTTAEGVCTIEAEVPLVEMFGYASVLRSSTEGKGTFSMEYYNHQPCMKHDQEKIAEEYAKSRYQKDGDLFDA